MFHSYLPRTFLHGHLPSDKGMYAGETVAIAIIYEPKAGITMLKRLNQRAAAVKDCEEEEAKAAK